ncbi:hypothetical protein [Nocardioides lianchengensis]|nr:hypothetical protein [Nocardioides lianchengensis]NYG09095.1 hypothetical protein [Nocardioides lianchengensis]
MPRAQAGSSTLAGAMVLLVLMVPADAASAADGAGSAVTTESALRAAWADPTRRRIDLGADVVLRDCHLGDPIRESPYPVVLEGHGHVLRQTCFEKRVLRQDGTGLVDLRHVTLTRGGADGPGAGLISRGEVLLSDCVVAQNLSEEPGGGVFASWRITARRCRISGNLANDDGGGLYARRGGVRVHDSVLSNNLVDGSGGAIGSTGDVLVVRSYADGNTTDGDGGALYADEDGDVTVVDSLIDGSDADGPGGAIFTVDGDVAVLDSTLIGNRADDRGGAIAGEADVLLVNTTVARNLAVAHAGGGVWARGDLAVVNSTVTDNYAEGEGGGLLTAGRAYVVSSTVTRNIASIAGDLGAAGPSEVFGSILGPPAFEGVTGDTIPTRRSCRLHHPVSGGHNFTTESSCGLSAATDIMGESPQLARLEDDPGGFVLEPYDDSPVRARIPSGSCRGRLPARVPAGQLLEAWLVWDRVLAHDALGNRRDTGAPCDIGAVQSAPLPGPERSAPPVPPPPAATEPAAVHEAAPARSRDRTRPRSRLGRLEVRVERLRRGVRRFDTLRRCTRPVGVDRLGDPRHRWGYAYDERDGTGLDRRPALAPTVGAPRWRLLALSPARRCLSRAPAPNGTGADARAARPTRRSRLARLERAVRVIDRKAARFDAWESCLTSVPVTQDGDAEQRLGYLARVGGRTAYRPALDLDRSERDDPDYQLLALGRCDRDPGEGVDRASARDRRSRIAALREDVADLRGPVAAITRFDECLYTVGARVDAGYDYRDRAGRPSRRRALVLDLDRPRLPQLSLLAFPGEEPPQLECNEDAGEGDD